MFINVQHDKNKKSKTKKQIINNTSNKNNKKRNTQTGTEKNLLY